MNTTAVISAFHRNTEQSGPETGAYAIVQGALGGRAEAI